MSITKPTKKQRVLEHLLKGGAITPLEALNMFGSLRLGAIIFELRQDGYNIDTKRVSNGRSCFARYRLRPEQELFQI